MRLRMLLVFVAALALTVGAATGAADGGQGNSDAAHRCQKGGWQNLFRSDGSSFTNQGDCVSYAALGGKLTTRSQSQLDCQGFLDGVYSSDSSGWSCRNFFLSVGGQSGYTVLTADCEAEIPGGHVLAGIPNAGTGRVDFFGCVAPI